MLSLVCVFARVIVVIANIQVSMQIIEILHKDKRVVLNCLIKIANIKSLSLLEFIFI